jgi:hypothetical protein
MDWSAKQRAELAHEYERIGYRPGERWAAPPEELGPEDLLALMRTIPDGAGQGGWMGALRNA